MNKFYRFVALIVATMIVCYGVQAQTTTYIYASGSSGSLVTGNVTSSAINDGSIVSTSTTQRGYAVFNLSSIPAGSTITSCVIGYYVATYAGSGTASGWHVYGYSGNLSTVSTASTLFADLVAGVSISTATYGTASATAKTIASNATTTALITANEGGAVTISWTGGSSRIYTITGETGTLATTGAHAPYLYITYTPPCNGTPTPGNTIASLTGVCTGSTTNLSLQNSTSGVGVSYQWYVAPDVSGSPGTFVAISGANSSTYTATVASTSWYECGVTCSFSSSTGYSTPVQITVLQVPTAITGSASVCNGASTTLASTPAGGSWSNDNATVATINSVSGVITGASVGSTHVTYTLSDGCIAALNEAVTVAPSPIIITPASAYSVCLGSAAVPTASSTIPGPVNIVYQDFNAGMTGEVGGTWTVVNSGASVPENWAISSSSDPFGDVSISGDGTPFMFADADAAGSGVNIITNLYSPSFSTVGLSSANLTFNYYCFSSSYYDAAAEIDYSTDGGSTWTQLYNYYNTTSGSYYWSAGTPTQTIPLPPGALGQANVKLRWYYNSTWGFWWAVDNIAVSYPTAAVASSAFTWTGVSGATGLSCTACSTPNITPTTAGNNVYSVSTTYMGCTVTNGVTVTALQPGVVAGNAPLCVGNSLTLSDGPSGGAWSSSSTGVATINAATGSVLGISAGIATMTYAVLPGCYATAAVSVSAYPNLSSFSLPSVAAPCIGHNATVNVSSTTLSAGTYTVTYNLSGSNSSTGNTSVMTFSGITGTFSIPSTLLATLGSTTVTVTSVANAAGCVQPATTGNTSIFSVNPYPASITGSTVICTPLTSNLLDATPGGAWTSSNNSIAAVGSSSGIVGAVTAGTAVISYTLPTGCGVSTGVTVNQTPAITGLTGTCLGASFTLSDVGIGGTWTSGNPFVATISSSGTVTGIVAGSATMSYTLASTGCSATYPITITPLPTPYLVTGGGSFCPGGSGLSIGLSASGLGVSYQVFYGGVATGGIVAGSGSSLTFGPYTGTGVYTIVANPGTTCATSMTGSATIANYPVPTAYAVSGGGNYCTGSAAPHIYLSGSNSGVSYQLYRSTTAVGSPIAGTSGVLDFGAVGTAGTYTVTATNTTTGCVNAMTGSAIVAVNALPTAYSVTGGGAYCAGGTGVPVNLSNSAAGVNYQLFVGGVATGSAVTGSGSLLPFGLQTVTGSYTVVATTAATGCSNNMTGSVAVSTVALPALNTVTGGGAYCNGATPVHIGLNGSVTGINYQLGQGGVNYGSAVAGTGGILDFGPVSPAGVYTVTATVAASTCSDRMTGSATVIVNPSPGVNNVTGGGPYCSGTGGVHIGLNGSNIGTNYFLYNGSTLTGGASGTGAPLDFGLLIPAGTYTVTGTVAGTGCSGSMTGSATITINALPPTFSVTGGGNYCFGGTGKVVGLSGSSSGVSYQLINGIAAVGSPVTGTGGSLSFGLQTAAGSYTVLATNTTTGCTATMTGSVAIVVNPLPNNYTVSGGGAYCAGGSGVDIRMANSDAGISYQLYQGVIPAGSAVTGTGLPIDFGMQTGAGTYKVVALNTSTSCTGPMPGSPVIRINALPNAYPVSGGGTVCAGSSGADISMAGSDVGVNYQLYNGSALVGTVATGSGSGIDFGLQASAGSYTVVATNPATGCVNSMTGRGVVTVAPLPTLYNVTGGGNICPGASVHVGISGSDVGVSYLLFNSGTGMGAGISGTGSSIDFGGFSTSGNYAVVGVNTITGCNTVMNGSLNITLNPRPVAHTVTGGGGYCSGGTGVTIGLNGSDVGVSYQMYRAGVLTGTPVAGTGSALGFGLQTLNGAYTIVATSAATGCTNNMTGSATVTINANPNTYLVSGGGTYCPGTGGVNIGLAMSDAGNYYQLYNGAAITGSPVAGTGTLLSFGLQTAAGAYTVTAVNATTGCSSIMTGSTSVAVATLPTVFNVTGGGAYCAGGAGAHVGLDGSVSGINYQLYNGAAAIGGPISGTGSPLDFGPLASGAYSVKATSSTTTCTSVMGGTVSVVSEPLPAATLVGGGGNYCAGSAGVLVTMGHSETGVNYQLYLDGTATGSAMAGTGSAVSFGPETAAGTYTVVAMNATTGCSLLMTGSSVVTILPTPTLFNLGGGGAYCTDGAGADVLLDGSSSGMIYQMYNATGAVGVPQAGTGASLDFGMQTVPGSYSVTATNMTTGCSSVMNGTPVVSLIPLPVLYNVTGGGSYCLGGSGVNVSLSGSASGVSYQLSNGGPIGAALTGTGSGLSFGPQRGGGSYSVIATDMTSGCITTMSGSATVSISSLPTAYPVMATSRTGYCAGGYGVGVFLSNSDVGVNYLLYHDGVLTGSSLPGSGGSISFGAQTAAGIYTIVGTSVSGGCTNSMSGSAAITINPLPSVFSVTGGGGYCAGGAGVRVGLSGSQAGTGYQLFHGGTAIGPVLASTGSSLDFGLQTPAGVYTIVASNTGTGCSSNMTGSATVVVNAAPTAFTVTGGGNYCAGGTGVDIGLSGSVSGVQYQLMNGSAVSGSAATGTGSSVDFGLKTLSGIYSVLATNTSTGCTANMAGGVSVTALPIPSSHALSGGGAYCSGGTGVPVGLTGSDAGITYRLYNGVTLVGAPVTGTGSALSFGMQTASGGYTVVAEDVIASCVSTMPGGVSVSVNPVPAIFSVAGGGNFCAGSAGAVVSVSGSQPGINYELYYLDSVVGTTAGTGSSIAFGPQAGVGSYTVRAVNTSTGCSSGMSGSSGITESAVVTPTLAISTGTGDTLCAGLLATFTAYATNSGSSPNYQWTVNGTLQSTSASYSYIPANGDVVALSMTSSAVCAVPATLNTSMVLNVLARQVPGVTVSANPGLEVCQGQSVVFSAVPSYGGPSPVYSWLKGGVAVGSGASYSYVPSVGDVISCKMTSDFQCRIGNTATSSAMNMIVDLSLSPTVSISVYPGVNVTKGETVTMTASVSNAGTDPSYQWYVDGNTITGATTNTYTSSSYLNGNVVSCQVTSSSSCAGAPTSGTVTMNVSTVGVNNISSNMHQVSVTPNPNSGTFIVSGSLNTTDKEAQIQVTNVIGQVVYEGIAPINNGVLKHQISLGNGLANGSYLLSVRTTDGLGIFHIVVEQ